MFLLACIHTLGYRKCNNIWWASLLVRTPEPSQCLSKQKHGTGEHTGDFSCPAVLLINWSFVRTENTFLFVFYISSIVVFGSISLTFQQLWITKSLFRLVSDICVKRERMRGRWEVPSSNTTQPGPIHITAIWQRPAEHLVQYQLPNGQFQTPRLPFRFTSNTLWTFV